MRKKTKNANTKMGLWEMVVAIGAVKATMVMEIHPHPTRARTWKRNGLGDRSLWDSPSNITAYVGFVDRSFGPDSRKSELVVSVGQIIERNKDG